jgi:hydrophobe/amphiphile efflux-1 (HAE1) family protein
MNLSAPFIHRPVATTLLMLSLMFAGTLAYFQLPVAPLPNIELPTIQVSATLPGGSPETMATTVATPLERRLGLIAGVTEMTSYSSPNRTGITLQFSLDRKIDDAARDVQAAINASLTDLPADMPSPPRAWKSNPANAPVMVLAVRSTTLPLRTVYDISQRVIAERLSQVEGVSQVDLNGAEKSAVRIDVDTRALSSLGLSMDDIRTALQASNIKSPTGRIGAGDRFFMIDAADQLDRPEQYRELIIAVRNGTPIKLGSVARIQQGPENVKLAGWFNGEPAVLLFIRKEASANIIATAEGVRAMLPQLQRWIPPALEITVVTDRTPTIRASVREVEHTIPLAAGLVLLAVILFLRRLRATAIPAATIPLSVAGTLAAMYMLGYSLNNLSLMALTVAVGFVVDDAIVVLENVVRHLERGATPLQAALVGSREVGFTIVSITVSLVTVFIPILFMGGILGRIFREFAMTLAIAVVVSAVVSLTLTPMMCSRLLRHQAEAPQGRIARALERILHVSSEFYVATLGWFLRRRFLSVLVTIACLAGSFWLYGHVPKGLFPQQDTGLLFASTDAAPDISFTAMADQQRQINKLVMDDPAVAGIVSFIGGSITSNQGRMTIVLKPFGERTERVPEIMARLRGNSAEIPGIQLIMFPAQDFRSGGRSTRANYQYTLLGENIDELQDFALRLADRMSKIAILKDVNSDRAIGGLESRVVVDRDRAKALGVPIAAIDAALYNAFGQRQVVTLYTERDQRHIVLNADESLLRDPNTLKSVRVQAAGGRQIPLDSLATIKMGNAPLIVAHQGLYPAITLSYNLANDSVALGDAISAIRRASVDAGQPATVRGFGAGTTQTFRNAQTMQPMLIVAALIAVYIVLGVLYESLIHPFTIIATLPSAGIGALLALIVTGEQLTVIATIGLILLIGIVKKNAIMLVDFALAAQRGEGLSAQDAMLAACRARFRPIMMTTLAALFGALPLAIGTGAGAEIRRPLGITIMGGLIFSQAITMYITPVLFVMFDAMAKNWSPRRLVRRTRPATN